METAFTSLGLAVLENASEVKVSETINGEFLLTFILPRTDPKWQYIQEENFVKVYDASQKKDQLFRIRSTDEQHDSTGKLTSNIQCEHIYYDALDCAFFPMFEMIGATPAAILQAAFAGTRFSVGTVEITTLTDIMMSRAYPANIIAKLIENVGGELIKDNWTVNLVSQRGSNTSVQFRIGKNIKGLKKQKDSKNIVTRLYPYGTDGLEISPVNGGQAFINSPLIGNYDRPHIGHKDYKDIDNNAELLAAALTEWSTSSKDGIDKPRITYSGNFAELKKLKEYGDYEAYGLGDTVRIIDEGIDTDTNQRIVQYANYPYEPKPSDVVFANYDPNVYRNNRPQNVLANTIGSGNKIESITNGKFINAIYVDNVRSRLQTEAGAAAQNALVHSDADMYLDNVDNPTKAILIGKGIFAIANSKKANGDWNWRTIATGDKLVADEVSADWVYAGNISADRIQGGSITGITFRTAASGSRIEITGNTLVTYNATGQMHGPRIYPGDGDLVFCRNGVPVLSVGLASSSNVSIQAMSGYNLVIQDYATEELVYDYAAPKATNVFGVFGIGPVSRQTATRLSTGASTLDIINKINGILDKLALYGLFNVTG
jgi:phage minor structural protein